MGQRSQHLSQILKITYKNGVDRAWNADVVKEWWLCVPMDKISVVGKQYGANAAWLMHDSAHAVMYNNGTGLKFDTTTRSEQGPAYIKDESEKGDRSFRLGISK